MKIKRGKREENKGPERGGERENKERKRWGERAYEYLEKERIKERREAGGKRIKRERKKKYKDGKDRTRN